MTRYRCESATKKGSAPESAPETIVIWGDNQPYKDIPLADKVHSYIRRVSFGSLRCLVILATGRPGNQVELEIDVARNQLMPENGRHQRAERTAPRLSSYSYLFQDA